MDLLIYILSFHWSSSSGNWLLSVDWVGVREFDTLKIRQWFLSYQVLLLLFGHCSFVKWLNTDRNCASFDLVFFGKVFSLSSTEGGSKQGFYLYRIFIYLYKPFNTRLQPRTTLRPFAACFARLEIGKCYPKDLGVFDCCCSPIIELCVRGVCLSLLSSMILTI